MRRNELIILSILAVFSLACILSTSGGSVLILKDESMPAHVYSNILAGILGIASIFRIIKILSNKDVKQAENKVDRSKMKVPLLITIIAILYTLGISYIGFYISTLICMLVLFMGFENWDKAKLKQGIIFSIGLCVIFFVTFYFLKIYLPDGLLI